MAAIPVADLVTRVRDLANEADTNHWTTAKIYTLLNDAQQEWAEVTRCLWRYATDTSVASQQEYATIDGFFPCTVNSVLFDGKELSPLRWFDEVYGYGLQNWNSTTGLPLRYYIRQDMLGFLPIPSATYAGKTIRIDGKAEPSTIDADTCANIDDVHQRHLAFYAASVILEADGESRQADKWMAKFMQGMASAKVLYQNTTPELRLQSRPPVAIVS